MERVRLLLECFDQLRLAVEDPRTTGEDAIDEAALDTRDLQDGTALRREVSRQQPQAPGFFERRGERMNDVPVGPRRIQPRDLLGERLTGACQRAPVEQPSVQQLAHDDRQAALVVDVHD